jgi:hypothetical protein
LDEAIVALERLSASSRRRAKLRQATGEVNEPEIEPIKARSQSS